MLILLDRGNSVTQPNSLLELGHLDKEFNFLQEETTLLYMFVDIRRLTNNPFRHLDRFDRNDELTKRIMLHKGISNDFEISYVWTKG